MLRAKKRADTDKWWTSASLIEIDLILPVSSGHPVFCCCAQRIWVEWRGTVFPCKILADHVLVWVLYSWKIKTEHKDRKKPHPNILQINQK